MVTARLYLFPLLVIAWFAVPASAAGPVYADRWLARDKALHCGVSALLAAGMYGGCRAGLGMGRDTAAAVSPFWVLTIGLAKEDHDLKIKGTGFSFRDLAADALGLAVGLGCAVAWDSVK